MLLNLLGTSFLVFNSTRDKEYLLNEIACLNTQVVELDNLMSLRVDENKSSLKELWELHPYLNTDSRTKLYEFVEIMKYCPGTNFVIAPGKASVEFLMVRDLYKALCSYQGPTAMITSVFRSQVAKSRHAHQRALDIAWDPAIADWLLSVEGEKWLKEYNIQVYFENIPSCKNGYSKYYMYNPAATGPHIHLQLMVEETMHYTKKAGA